MTCKDCMHYYVCSYVELKNENIDCSHFKNTADYAEAYKKLQTAKSDAIKEFAQRLKEKALTTVRFGRCGEIDCYDIDNLVKEMTEENK